MQHAVEYAVAKQCRFSWIKLWLKSPKTQYAWLCCLLSSLTSMFITSQTWYVDMSCQCQYLHLTVVTDADAEW